MLKLALIKPGTSPFSSRVLLVKIKDRIWRFCIDYIALNVVSVKGRFPIPIVDDMIDELYGANYFTNLICVSDIITQVNSSDIYRPTFRTHI